MSSHHFVVEGQEPALFIFQPISYYTIQPLLEWAPFVLVSEAMMEEVLSWGIRIDAVIFTQEHEKEIREHLAERQFLELVLYTSDSNPFTEGIRYLAGRDQHSVNVTTLKAPDFFTQAASSFNSVSVVLLEESRRWIPVNDVFKKWFQSGTRLWIRKTFDNQVIHATGLKANDDFWVVEEDGIVVISSADVVWVGETV